MSFLARLKKQVVIATAVALWIPAVSYGISVLWKYSTTPGRPGTPPLNWPSNVAVRPSQGKPTLIMFAHPQCECSDASVGELGLIMAHAQGQVEANVFFYLPAKEPSTWARTDLWRSASAIPGVRVFEDREAAMAQTFGAFTSGQTLLYDAHGHLLFEGGITGFRGHSGDNAGRTAVAALLQRVPEQQIPLPIMTPVLGCSLRGEL